MFAYSVRCSFEAVAARDAFIVWLRERHIADVITAGAEDAELVVIDGALAVEIHYRFSTRAAFGIYEAEHAPRLRAEGQAEVARIGAAVTMTRTTGEVISWSQEG